MENCGLGLEDLSLGLGLKVCGLGLTFLLPVCTSSSVLVNQEGQASVCLNRPFGRLS